MRPRPEEYGAEFLNLSTTDIWGKSFLVFLKCRLFRSIPDLYPLEAIATAKLWQPRVPWGSKTLHLTYMTSYKAVTMICYLRTGWCMHYKLFQSCPTLCDLMDCSPPSSSVHGILQARILEWVAMPCSRGSSQPKDQTHISYIYLHWQEGSLPLAPSGKLVKLCSFN